MSDVRALLASQSASEKYYFLKHTPTHLAKAKCINQLYRCLTNFDFIQAKVANRDIKVQELIDDYDIALGLNELMSGEKAETLRAIQGAIRKSAHILAKDPTQLAGQLLGRLLSYEITRVIDDSKYFWEYLPLIGEFLPNKPVKKVTEKIRCSDEMQAMLEQAQHWREASWLRPLTPSLERPGEGALRTLIGHTSYLTAVAINPDGKFAVSASRDNTLKIWDLTRGAEVRTLKGHTSSVTAVEIAPDGKFAVSTSDDKTLKIWDQPCQGANFSV